MDNDFINVIVAGGRDFSDYQLMKSKLDIILKNLDKSRIRIVSGGAKGADSLGERYAIEKKYELLVIKAKWEKHGNAAGPIRNREMAEIGNYCVVFWDGQSRGSKNMIEEAKKRNIPTKVIEYKNTLIYNVVNDNLFNYENEYYLAHCISYDCALGAGIAKEFEKRYNLREKLIPYIKKNKINWPNCVLVGKVFNLITKEICTGKPTLGTLIIALNYMKQIAIKKDIKKIAMPLIGCGLDKLIWEEVEILIKDTFKNTGIEILICKNK